MPGGPVDYTTLASAAVGGADESTWHEGGVDTSLLVTGPNVLAVEIHQNAASSSDISFDAGLDAELAEPPSRGVVLTTPATGSSYTAPVNLTLTATAVPAGGSTITAVEFFDGSTSLGSDPAVPYSVVWNNVPPGLHVLTARAQESTGAMLTSAPVSITVAAPALPRQLVSQALRGNIWTQA